MLQPLLGGTRGAPGASLILGSQCLAGIA